MLRQYTGEHIDSDANLCFSTEYITCISEGAGFKAKFSFGTKKRLTDWKKTLDWSSDLYDFRNPQTGSVKFAKKKKKERKRKEKRPKTRRHQQIVMIVTDIQT
jgi:hypothetical protein